MILFYYLFRKNLYLSDVVEPVTPINWKHRFKPVLEPKSQAQLYKRRPDRLHITSPSPHVPQPRLWSTCENEDWDSRALWESVYRIQTKFDRTNGKPPGLYCLPSFQTRRSTSASMAPASTVYNRPQLLGGRRSDGHEPALKYTSPIMRSSRHADCSNQGYVCQIMNPIREEPG